MEPSAYSRVDGLRHKGMERRTYAGVRVWEGGCLSLPSQWVLDTFVQAKVSIRQTIIYITLIKELKIHVININKHSDNGIIIADYGIIIAVGDEFGRNNGFVIFNIIRFVMLTTINFNY